MMKQLKRIHLGRGGGFGNFLTPWVLTGFLTKGDDNHPPHTSQYQCTNWQLRFFAVPTPLFTSKYHLVPSQYHGTNWFPYKLRGTHPLFSHKELIIELYLQRVVYASQILQYQGTKIQRGESFGEKYFSTHTFQDFSTSKLSNLLKIIELQNWPKWGHSDIFLCDERC